MDESRIKHVEHGIDMCEELRDYLVENKICGSDDEVIEFFVQVIKYEGEAE